MIDYISCGAESLKLNEKHDCSVKALSIALNCPYNIMHALYKAYGRKSRHKTPLDMTEQIMNDLLMDTTRYIIRNGFKKYTPRSIVNAYPTGVIICITNGHMFTVVDGVVKDWCGRRCLRIEFIYKIK